MINIFNLKVKQEAVTVRGPYTPNKSITISIGQSKLHQALNILPNGSMKFDSIRWGWRDQAIEKNTIINLNNRVHKRLVLSMITKGMQSVEQDPYNSPEVAENYLRLGQLKNSIRNFKPSPKSRQLKQSPV